MLCVNRYGSCKQRKKWFITLTICLSWGDRLFVKNDDQIKELENQYREMGGNFYFIFIIKEILSFRSSFCYSCISGFCLFGVEKLQKMIIIIHMIILPVKTSQHLPVCGLWGICSFWLNKVQCNFWRLTCNIKYSYRHYKNAKWKIIIPSKRRTWLRCEEVFFFQIK